MGGSISSPRAVCFPWGRVEGSGPSGGLGEFQVSLARRAGPSELAVGVLLWVLARLVFLCTGGWSLTSACPCPPRLSLWRRQNTILCGEDSV